jgi:hypothetical protein
VSLVISLSILLPVAYAVAFDSVVANAIASVGVPWLPDVVKVSAVVDVPAVVLTAVDVSAWSACCGLSLFCCRCHFCS